MKKLKELLCCNEDCFIIYEQYRKNVKLHKCSYLRDFQHEHELCGEYLTVKINKFPRKKKNKFKNEFLSKLFRNSLKCFDLKLKIQPGNISEQKLLTTYLTMYPFGKHLIQVSKLMQGKFFLQNLLCIYQRCLSERPNLGDVDIKIHSISSLKFTVIAKLYTNITSFNKILQLLDIVTMTINSPKNNVVWNCY